MKKLNRREERKAGQESNLFRRREGTEPHMSYAHEKERHRVITEGRCDLLDEALKIPADGTSGILARDPLRARKNLFITAITTFTRAAMDGGLPEEIAYAMSDTFILQGEDCQTFVELEELYLEAFRDFTYAVSEEKERQYSAVIEAVFQYIHIHLHEKITLEMAAEAVGMSACYLSRIFKRETGESFVDYIQKKRVEAAKHMLIYSDYTLAAISEYLHFSTQSYFIRVFRKQTGMTPGQYRKYYKTTGKW
ncbi:MAG: AraC family transcriptional regulator [Clostridiales bacterium]|nr:AraC family transcriptional regulator [Clostridiales bacterium]